MPWSRQPTQNQPRHFLHSVADTVIPEVADRTTWHGHRPSRRISSAPSTPSGTRFSTVKRILRLGKIDSVATDQSGRSGLSDHRFLPSYGSADARSSRGTRSNGMRSEGNSPDGRRRSVTLNSNFIDLNLQTSPRQLSTNLKAFDPYDSSSDPGDLPLNSQTSPSKGETVLKPFRWGQVLPSASDLFSSPDTFAAEGNTIEVVPETNVAAHYATPRTTPEHSDASSESSSVASDDSGDNSKIVETATNARIKRDHLQVNRAAGARPQAQHLALSASSEVIVRQYGDTADIIETATDERIERAPSQPVEPSDATPPTRKTATNAGIGVWSQLRVLARSMTAGIDCDPFCCFRGNDTNEDDDKSANLPTE